MSETTKNTAETVLFFDQLFDSVNGAAKSNKKNKGKLLRTAVSDQSPHHTFWQKAIDKLKEMKYIDRVGNEKSVPSIKNFIITLKSFMRLWQLFKTLNLNVMRPRYFNSDPIENFFGQVRAYNYRNNDPNCHSFNCTFKSLLITRIIKFHNEAFNCEDDSANQIINLKTLFQNNESGLPIDPTLNKNMDMVLEQARRERMNVHSRAYTAGWVVYKILKIMQISKCQNCKESLLSINSSSVHEWIVQKEYTAGKNRLNYPSEGVIRCFGSIVKETNEYLESCAHKTQILSSIKSNILSKYSFDFVTCTEHKTYLIDHFLSITIRLSIVNWCSIINKILKGTDVFRLQNCLLPPMQRKAFEKYKKKLKNKRLNKYFPCFIF